MALKKSTATAAKAPVKRQATVKKTATNTVPKDTLIENTAATILNESAENQTISLGDLQNLRSKKDLSDLLVSNNSNPKKLVDAIKYEEELEKLQIELVKLQRWVQEKGARIAILFEGRDAAGKGGTIRRFTEHLNPRAMRVVALPKPTEEERGQWYFQRYTRQLPNKGEIVFFDRSWYNRAVVEPVNGFCTTSQYNIFMQQVPELEHMLYEDGIIIIKFWFSIAKEEQLRHSVPEKQIR